MTNDELRSSGFGPLQEFGDKPQSDRKTWALLCACFLPWVLLGAWAAWAAWK